MKGGVLMPDPNRCCRKFNRPAQGVHPMPPQSPAPAQSRGGVDLPALSAQLQELCRAAAVQNQLLTDIKALLTAR